MFWQQIELNKLNLWNKFIVKTFEVALDNHIAPEAELKLP